MFIIYNIQQVTNFSDVVKNAPVIQHTFLVGNSEYKTAEYAILTESDLTFNSAPINKLGYVCESRGIDYPIYFMIQDELKEIYLGKTGIYEVQTEEFYNINETEPETFECVPEITTIHVPKDVVFKLDYVYNI